eukprot:m.64971 g.64971  ORF g.64971 m.64971 type:complete len:546 (+) comp11507_c0_seq1:105-1742(+)
MSSDDEGNECPLCMEPFEADDKQFYPCHCGYQICRFCWHRIRSEENGLCPACRQPYSDKPAEYNPVSQTEIQKMKEDKRQKRLERKQKIIEERKALANVRVIQKNLVYVVGLPQKLADEHTLKKNEYLGRFGKIMKVVVNRTPYGNPTSPTFSAYVTYGSKETAFKCVDMVDGSYLDGKPIRAYLGTTKYCSSFLKCQPCNNPDCMYLHELGDEAVSYTKEEMLQGKHVNDKQPPVRLPVRSRAMVEEATKGQAESQSPHPEHDYEHEHEQPRYASPSFHTEELDGSSNRSSDDNKGTVSSTIPQARTRSFSDTAKTVVTGKHPSPPSSSNSPLVASNVGPNNNNATNPKQHNPSYSSAVALAVDNNSNNINNSNPSSPSLQSFNNVSVAENRNVAPTGLSTPKFGDSNSVKSPTSSISTPPLLSMPFLPLTRCLKMRRLVSSPVWFHPKCHLCRIYILDSAWNHRRMAHYPFCFSPPMHSFLVTLTVPKHQCPRLLGSDTISSLHCHSHKVILGLPFPTTPQQQPSLQLFHSSTIRLVSNQHPQ